MQEVINIDLGATKLDYLVSSTPIEGKTPMYVLNLNNADDVNSILAVLSRCIPQSVKDSTDKEKPLVYIYTHAPTLGE